MKPEVLSREFYEPPTECAHLRHRYLAPVHVTVVLIRASVTVMSCHVMSCLANYSGMLLSSILKGTPSVICKKSNANSIMANDFLPSGCQLRPLCRALVCSGLTDLA